ncbi:MAG: ATP-dependent helicase HrpB [Victivallales bacterium]|nr:ATP-dependent helicase HrpB [Victivallales bacterium]
MLPIHSVKEQILLAIHQGAVVITAPTGSGKSTQVPRFLLEAVPEGSRILVLQPRRIAARMLAERVAFEMNEKLGGTIGFQTRYERAVSAATRILFITEGILTKMMVADHSLKGVSAIVFDEFHERNVNTDLGLAMARHLRDTVRKDLKLAVMSATMDATPISNYLNCPVVNSEGRMYDVAISYCTQQVKMLGPAAAAAKELVALLNSGVQGDVLIFMPGAYEIRKTIEACGAIKTQEKLAFLPLYGDLSPDAQRKVMEPAECRKVIVATNIAETSLTIPGVRHVIDSGLAKYSFYDSARGIDSLETRPIARDSADQRSGRAGREAPGTCRRLWSWIEQSAKNPRTLPEIQRVDLAEAVLAVKAFGFNDVNAFPWYEKPQQRMLDNATQTLTALGFISESDGGLTETGKLLQSFPAHPRLALLMWLGSQDGCYDLACYTAAIISERPLLSGAGVSPSMNRERRQSAKRKARGEKLPASDFITLIDSVQSAREARFQPDFCQRLGINEKAARDVCRAADDFMALGNRMDWRQNNADDSEEACLKCILRTFPDRLARRKDSGSLVCLLPMGRRAELARESVVRDESLFVAAEIREVAAVGIQSSKLMLSLASGIREDWLLDYFPDAWTDIDEPFWDEQKQQVFRRTSLSCLGLCLDEKVRNDPPADVAGHILAEHVAEQMDAGRVPLEDWNDGVSRWIERVHWVASIFPEEGLPAYDDAGRMKVLEMLCQGETSIRALRNKDTLAYAKQLLSYKQQQFVDAMAPPFIMLPNGRRMKIDYAVGQTPKGKAKIQDLYDVKQTPTVANGRVRILLDILAPNFRTVQITDDLTNFWNTLYPKIRTELSRRYPKHKWI